MILDFVLSSDDKTKIINFKIISIGIRSHRGRSSRSERSSSRQIVTVGTEFNAADRLGRNRVRMRQMR